MLRGELSGLRARHDSDVPVLHEELYEDVAMRSRADTRPWRPISPGSAASPYAVSEPSDDTAVFSVVRLPSEDLAGDALLWGIDAHNRCAHLGLSLRPSFRGLGLGTDVVRVLCYYGFAIRGLRRLQVETLADNTTMISAALRAGFTREGLLRKSAWADGSFLDEIIFGLLDDEWRSVQPVGS